MNALLVLLRLAAFLVLVGLEVGLIAAIDAKLAPSELTDEERGRRRVALIAANVIAFLIGVLW